MHLEMVERRRLLVVGCWYQVSHKSQVSSFSISEGLGLGSRTDASEDTI